jgi:hypothetical protein
MSSSYPPPDPSQHPQHQGAVYASHQQGLPSMSLYQPPMPDESVVGNGMSAQSLHGQGTEQRQPRSNALQPYSGIDTSTGRKFSLEVVQQPQRARMCGFGDKDRRPITPPPCVQLRITDLATGRDVDFNKIEHTCYVLNVDLWSEDGQREVNLVRHSTTTPSISSTSPASYSQIADSTPAFAHILPSNRDNGYGQASLGYTSPLAPPPMVPPYGIASYGQGKLKPSTTNEFRTLIALGR